MSAKPDDLLDFYNADLGPTLELDLSAVSAHTTDAQGRLPPGRYLLQIVGMASTTVAWMRMVPFKVSDNPTTAAAPPAFPFANTTILEVNIRKDFSDRIVAILDAADTAKLYITRMSRPVITNRA